jgi:hypothetical protein
VIAIGQKFDQQMISIDGGTFRDCKFTSCVLFFSGVLPVDLRGSTFSECRWEFAGPAGNTISFLRALYERGEKPLVEAVFANVRGETGHDHDHDDHHHDHSH